MSAAIAAPRCPNCGSEGPTSGKGFCEVCGDFVDWGGVVEQARQEAVRAAEAAHAQAAPGGDLAAGRPLDRPDEVEPAAGAPPEDPEGERRRARELLVPLTDGVDPVLPGRPEPARPDVKALDPDDESGITCWNCGVGNRSDRRFCRNCGVDLSAAPTTRAASSPSPWSRFLAWLRDHRILVAVVAVAVILAGVAATLVPRLLAGGDTITVPVNVSASSFDPAHPPLDAFDQNTVTSWRSAGGGPASLTVEFSRPVDVSATRIVPATGGDRPTRVALRFTDAQGQERTVSGRLGDGAVQQVPTPIDAASRVTIEFSGDTRDAAVAIAEVQFLPAT